MRRAAIMSLRWNQIDFSRGLILVQGTKTARNWMVPMNGRQRNVAALLRTHDFELFTSASAEIVNEVGASGARVFLDLKLQRSDL